MPSEHDGVGTVTYRPTSLDFINLPNPVEPTQPQTISQKHPLNGTPRLEHSHLGNNANQDLFRLILDPPSERPAKRRKSIEPNVLDLPKLPVRTTPKRPRIPPTLSGLHQPPPDAGLLPSINTEQPEVPPPRAQDVTTFEAPLQTPSKAEVAVGGSAPESQQSALAGTAATPINVEKPRRKQRNKWTDEETDELLKGVARFGVGNWAKIVKCPEFSFNDRTAVDLKDRFRVCCPSDHSSRRGSAGTPVPQSATDEDAQRSSKSFKGPLPERVSESRLRKLGVVQTLPKTARRSRHNYTAEEDEALLKGYRKHGNSWATIRNDEDLDLSHLRAADLRDRFRNRYPAELKKAAEASNDQQTSGSSQAAETASENRPTALYSEVLLDPIRVTAPPGSTTATDHIDKEDMAVFKPPTMKKRDGPSLFSLDDLFLGMPFGAEDDGAEHIVLDRGILDWATGDSAKGFAIEQSKSLGIDPRMTLKLPKPISTVPVPLPPAPPLEPAAPPPPASMPALPSLSSVLPEMVNPEQLELPSLMQWYDVLEGDFRSGVPHIPTLEELLSS